MRESLLITLVFAAWLPGVPDLSAMSARVLLLWSLALTLFNVQVSTYNLGDSCKSSDCIIKCCGKNQIYLVDMNNGETGNCVDSTALIKTFNVTDPNNYSEVDVYNKDIKRKIIKTNKSVHSFRFEYVANFTNTASNLGNVKDLPHDTYLVEDGTFVLRRLNYWNQWTIFEPGQFCIEHEVTLDDGELDSTSPDVVVWVIPDRSEERPSNTRAVRSAYGLLVSCVFLLLVLVVYALLPELRNLAGLILMSYMATYFAFFLTRVIHVFGNDAVVLTTNACIIITVIFYYLMLSTFCWMNVMSFDIWWTFRGLRKAAQIHRRGVMSKFRRYCAYAWGVPVLPTLFVVVVDQLDLKHLPNFVKPHIFDNTCYFEPEVHLLYVSIPSLILICVNVVLFLLTAYNIWEVNRGVTISKDSTNSKKKESYRFWVYLRLSLVMGVSWILEVIGNLVDPESPVWIISDLYTALVGLFIFLLFVCKKKIFLQLCTRLSIDNKLVRWVRAQADDSRAADVYTKNSVSHHTEASEVETWAPAYKDIRNRPDNI